MVRRMADSPLNRVAPKLAKGTAKKVAIYLNEDMVRDGLIEVQAEVVDGMMEEGLILRSGVEFVRLVHPKTIATA